MQGQARFPTGIQWVLGGALGVLGGALGVLLLPVTVRAQSSDAVTYAKDVAPIIQQNCQTCHRHGQRRADVAAHLRGRAAVGAPHPGEGGDSADAALANRHGSRYPGVQE